MAVKYTICAILMIKVFCFFSEFCVKKIKKGQSKAQQQYIQGFFKKKPCQRKVNEVQWGAVQVRAKPPGRGK